MADIEDRLGQLEGTIQGLEATVEGAESVASAFRSEMESMTEAMQVASRDAGSLSRSLGSNLKGAMDDLILDGARLSDVLKNIGRSLASTVLGSAMRPVQQALGGAFAKGIGSVFGGFFADGAAFSSGRVQAFAQGGVVDRTTRFPMRGGMGIMGEAGPEAIMPLSRGPDGRLGVRSSGGGRPVMVTMNISTPDANSFRRSRTQIASQLSRALGQGRRNQ